MPTSLQIASKGLLDRGTSPSSNLASEGLLRDAGGGGPDPEPGGDAEWLITARRRGSR